MNVNIHISRDQHGLRKRMLGIALIASDARDDAIFHGDARELNCVVSAQHPPCRNRSAHTGKDIVVLIISKDM